MSGSYDNHRSRSKERRHDGQHHRPHSNDSGGSSRTPSSQPRTPADWKAVHEAEHDADEVIIDGMRERAEAHLKRKRALLDESHAAYEAGQKGRAKELSEEGKREGRLFDQTSQEAAEAIFRLKNGTGRLQLEELDLHGLHVSEAVHYVKTRLRLDQRSNPQPHTLVVIYGAGNHSANHVGKLKPAVLELLHDAGLDVAEGQPNHGSCTVRYHWDRDGQKVDHLPVHHPYLPPHHPQLQAQPGQALGQGLHAAGGGGGYGSAGPVSGVHIRVVDGQGQGQPHPYPGQQSYPQGQPHPAPGRRAVEGRPVAYAQPQGGAQGEVPLGQPGGVPEAGLCGCLPCLPPITLSSLRRGLSLLQRLHGLVTALSRRPRQ